MDQTKSNMAQQIAQAAIAFEQRRGMGRRSSSSSSSSSRCWLLWEGSSSGAGVSDSRVTTIMSGKTDAVNSRLMEAAGAFS